MDSGSGILGKAAVHLDPTLTQRAAASVLTTLRFWMQTEVHVYAFSVGANVLLAFFPFLIVSLSLTRLWFDQQTTVAAIDFALRDFFPDALGQFLHNNLPQRRPAELFSMVLLFFAANGIFEPLEVAFNRIWGIARNRSYIRNQAVSLVLIFVCGGLTLISLSVSALQLGATRGMTGAAWAAQTWISSLFFKVAVLPLAALALLLIYRFLPYGRPPMKRIVPAAIVVGVLLEVLKYVNLLVWPWVDARIAREYGVFRYSVTLIFLGFIVSMLVLAGAEWAARGHRLDCASLEEQPLEPSHQGLKRGAD
jgi:membrane protein